jgi:hypothetical protein
VKITRPVESISLEQPQLKPALLKLSGIQFPVLHVTDSASLCSPQRNNKNDMNGAIVKESSGVAREETVQQTARGQELNGDLTWRGVYELARPPITASPHRRWLAVAAKQHCWKQRKRPVVAEIPSQKNAGSHPTGLPTT